MSASTDITGPGLAGPQLARAEGARPELVGGFVLGGLAIIVAAILFFGGGQWFQTTAPAVAYFGGSVSGLSPGALVTFRGVNVGSVETIALVIDPSGTHARIPVSLRLEPDRVKFASGAVRQPTLRQLIAAGLRARLVPKSLITGQMQVELDFRPGTSARLEGDAASDVPEIPTISSGLERLRDQLTEAPIEQTVTQALRTLSAVEQVANKLGGQIDPLAERASRVLDTADTSIKQVRHDASSTLHDASAALHDASSTLDEAHGLALDLRKQVAIDGPELRHALLSADRAMHGLNGVTTSVNGIVAQRAPARADLEATLHGLATSSDSLSVFSHEIERKPSLLLWGAASR